MSKKPCGGTRKVIKKFRKYNDPKFTNKYKDKKVAKIILEVKRGQQYRRWNLPLRDASEWSRAALK